jgi:hypothetical protein
MEEEMIGKRKLLALMCGLVLLAGCNAGATAPARTAAANVPAAPGEEFTADTFTDAVLDAQASVKTYTTAIAMETEMVGKATKVTSKVAVDQSDKGNISMLLDTDVGGMKMTLLKVDGDMYVKMQLTGEKWLKVPKSQMAQYEGTAGAADLPAGLERARSATREVRLIGGETIDATNTGHYRITMDPAGLSQLTGSGATIIGDTFDYDIWLDEAGLIRKVAMDVRTEVAGKAVPMTMVGVMGDYNDPVTITAPAKEDVADLPG